MGRELVRLYVDASAHVTFEVAFGETAIVNAQLTPVQASALARLLLEAAESVRRG
jgi:hypothetical protein